MKVFKFSKSLDILAERIAAAPIHIPITRVDMFQELLSIPDFPAHLANQLNNIRTRQKRAQHWNLCWEFIQINQIPDPNAASIEESFYGKGGFSAFRDEDVSSHEKRSGDVYPLTRDETIKARLYLNQNPEMHAAIAAIQAGISIYLKDLSAGLIRKTEQAMSLRTDMTDEDVALRAGILSSDTLMLIKGAQSHSFLRDMSPILAAAFSDQDNDQSFGVDQYRAGLLLAFERNAFLGAAPGIAQDFKCPFRHYFAQALATTVGRDDGMYHARGGDKVLEFGSLISFFHDHFSSEDYNKPMQLVAQEVA